MENYQGTPADAIVMKCENLNGKVLAYRESPLGTGTDDSLVRVVNGTAAALGKLDEAVGALDPLLDILAQRRAVEPAFTALQIRLASARASAAKAASILALSKTAFYEPAAVNNIVDLTADIERRAVFAACDQSEKERLWDRMAAGELGPLLAALGRLEFTATADRARVLFKALASERNPSKVAAFDLEDERLAWADVALSQIEATIDAASNVLGPALAVAVEPERAAA